MFQLVSSDTQSPASGTVWQPASIAGAVRSLGWRGAISGPVEFRGTSFVAVCGNGDFGAPGSGWLVGCLVPAADPLPAMQDASLLAGYSARAILLRQGYDVVNIQLQTALLDQGAVIEDNGQFVVLSTPGDVVHSPLQDDDGWRTDSRWCDLRRVITAAGSI